ncbi:MAG: hypothetical protein ACREXX_13635 [Gammaproteobacteria bacterium]
MAIDSSAQAKKKKFWRKTVLYVGLDAHKDSVIVAYIPDGHERSWTSVSFLINWRGLIRHVHLGGKLAPDTDGFRVMRAKILALLAEDPCAVARNGGTGGRQRRARREVSWWLMVRGDA